MKILFLVTFFIATLFADFQEGVQIDSFGYFEDNTTKLSIKDVKEKTFHEIDSKKSNFGFTRSAYWFKTTFEVNQKQIWYFIAEYPLLQKVDFYLFDEDGKLLKKLQTGMLRNFSDREVKNRYFILPMDLDKDQKYQLLSRVQTEGAMQFPSTIVNANNMIYHEQDHLLLMGIYYGTFLLLVFFNIMLYIHTKIKDHLYYLWFIGSFIIWQLSLDGTGIQYFWGDSDFLKHYSAIFGMSMTVLSAYIFARKFLRVSYYFPRLDKVIAGIIYLLIINFIASLSLDYFYMAQVNMILSIITSLFLLLLSIMVYKKGFSSAWWYILGWSSVLLGTLFFALNKSGYLSDIYITYYAQQIGSFFEMLFLSWALSDNAKLILDESIAKKDTLNIKLKEAVDQAIKKARDKDKILIQQSRFAALGEMIEQIAHQWRQPLNTLALINQDIYFKIQLGTFTNDSYEVAHVKMNESLQYMSKTIDDFRDFYKNDEKVENFELLKVCESAFSLSDAMLHYAKIEYQLHENGEKSSLFGNKNQLIQVIMNLIKNSHDAIVDQARNEGNIKLTILSDEEKIIILFEDDGGGINSDVIDKIFEPYFTTKDAKKGTGVGLAMIKEILEKSFSATIIVSNSAKGAVFRITIPKNLRVS